MEQLSADKRERLRQDLLACGFSICGFTGIAHRSEVRQHYNQWLAAGYAGGMTWLIDSAKDRLEPQLRFSWAQTVIVLGLAYDQPKPDLGVLPHISRYAVGRSYHRVMRQRLKRAQAVLRAYDCGQAKAYSDTGPVLERAYAQAAGLGWQGKNTLLLNAEWGSYLFLAVIFVERAIVRDSPETDHCGSCRACLDACPTQAFVQAGVLDSRRCISYLNIEHRGEFVPPYDAEIMPWLHGCDICQEVCPFVGAARRRGRLGDEVFAADQRWASANLVDLAKIAVDDWDRLTRGSDLRRGGVQRMRRIAERLLVAQQASAVKPGQSVK